MQQRVYCVGLPLKTKLKDGGENFSTGWKGSLKGSCLHWLRMVIMMLLPLHQEPGKKSGKPGQVWFNQTYQAFVKKTSLVKSLVRLVLPGF